MTPRYEVHITELTRALDAPRVSEATPEVRHVVLRCQAEAEADAKRQGLAVFQQTYGVDPEGFKVEITPL
jgi:hypothetical protein